MTADDVRSRLWLIEDEYLRSCIENGINVLTNRFGDSWPNKIELEILDMADTCNCIIGQTFETLGFSAYRAALLSLQTTVESAYLYGFDVRHASFYTEANPFNYADLEEAWRTVLSENH